jgi:ABC-type transporter Mla subunit MlaD
MSFGTRALFCSNKLTQQESVEELMATVRANNGPETLSSELRASDDAVQQASKEAAPIAARVSVHRGRISQAVRELESEQFELVARLDHLRRQFEAVENGIHLQIADVEDTLRLYENGLNSVPLGPH